jgi:hypothetical protein
MTKQYLMLYNLLFEQKFFSQCKYSTIRKEAPDL